MTDIPEDIMKVVREQCDAVGVTRYSDMRIHCVHIASHAVLAERRRCAEVATSWGEYSVADDIMKGTEA